MAKHQKMGATVTSTKPVNQPHSFSLPTRNSSIELLRLVCMLMIVGYHYAYTSAGHWIAEQPFSLAKLIYQCLMGGGWVGNFVFFTISIWFLLDRKQTLQSNLRRVWILERELLFWSIALFLITIVLRKHDIFTGSLSTQMLALRCFLPLSLNIWWYPTSYALFLVFLPFLNIGMRRLSQRQHCQLACICLLLWGLLGLIPKLSYNLTESTVFVFIYWYILISYYRWHMKPFSTRRCWSLIGIGVGIDFIYLLGSNLLYSATGKAASAQLFIFDKWKLPTMLIGFGMFLLAERTGFRSRAVNVLAASAFGVYLIHFYPPILASWTYYLSVERMFTTAHPILFGLLTIFAVFVACLLMDLIRQGFFKLTFDRHRGRLFDRLWKKLPENSFLR
ncbi:acyltransferase family protein [Corynebacterium stationis]|uniref:acyltransferase family protein n=1 Tax=Corynebacterium stationis TaxID=1705 RepID=UPI00321FF8AA